MYSLPLLQADFFDSPAVRLVIGFAIVVILILVLVYVVKKFRVMAFGHEDASMLDHLGDFREMRDTGQIDEGDYRKLKSQLSQQALKETIGKEPNSGEQERSGESTTSGQSEHQVDSSAFRPSD